jgi:glycosyltransferase involved in cell wall biosynthesis
VKFLFVHQNFPAQFRHLVAALADRPEHQVIAIGENANLKARGFAHPRVQLLGYDPHAGSSGQTHHYLRDFEAQVRRGQSVARLALILRDRGYRPDVLVVHPAWGEGLFLRDVFPQARQVHYFEFFYRSEGADIGFDPEFPAIFDDYPKLRMRNSAQLHSLDTADFGIAPTQWQKSRYPVALQERIRVIHEGVDSDRVAPDPQAAFAGEGFELRAGDEVLTYVARNLEPYRGFHIFLRALPAILAARPQARVLVVGGDEVSYGRRLPSGECYRERYCRELGERVDWSRVHFLGRLAYGDYLRVLQVSRAHVYLTYPFVLSWSMLEAMAAGCALVASATAPVQEVVRDGENGLLVDFFDIEALAARVVAVLADPQGHASLRARARASVVENYDLRRCCLPRQIALLEEAGQV